MKKCSRSLLLIGLNPPAGRMEEIIMTLIEMKNKVRAVCNNHSCFDCPLFSICVNISKSKDETPGEWEKRFYLTLHAKLQTINEEVGPA